MMSKAIALIAAALVLGSVSGVSAEEDTARYAAIEKCVAQTRRAWPHAGIRGNQIHRAAAFRRCMAQAGF
jgi:hypothetical protein